MTTNPNFYNYFCESNNVLGMRQVVNLAKIAAFCKDVTLREDRQSELKKQSLEFWNVPDKARTAPPRYSTSFSSLILCPCLTRLWILGGCQQRDAKNFYQFIRVSFTRLAITFQISFILFHDFSGVLDDKACKLLNSDMLREKITSVYEWRCAVIGLEEENPLQTFFLSNWIWYLSIDQKKYLYGLSFSLL